MSNTGCAYCGACDVPLEREHVVPACLYPPSKANSKVQRLTVPACRSCNNGWSDDEAHFRTVLVLAGDPPNAPRHELWQEKVVPSFDEPDARRRLDDIISIMKTLPVDGEERQKIYPADDPRVLRVIKKIVRGLSHYHRLGSPIGDAEVWADILRYQVPSEALSRMAHHHREADIVEYAFEAPSAEGVRSSWLLTFFQQVTFVGMVLEGANHGKSPDRGA